MERVQRCVLRDPQTGLIVGTCDADERDFRARCITAGAKSLRLACGTVVDGSSAACRNFWRLWARYVLWDAGLVVIQGVDYVVELSGVGYVVRPAIPDETQGLFLRYLAEMLAARAKQYLPVSAEHWAILLETTLMLLDVATLEGTKDELAQQAARAAAVIGMVVGEDRAQLMLPYAERGRNALQSISDAGKARAEKARRESRANAWRQEVAARRAGSAEAAYARIERREGLRPGTVKKAIIRLRKKRPPLSKPGDKPP
jgi:hypothetical protein